MQSLIRYSVTFLGIAFVSAMAHAQAEHECVIQPRQILEIRSPVDGLIQRVHVDRGQTVRRGQLLATLDDSVERVAAEGARHRASMLGAVQAGESRVTATSRKLERCSSPGRNRVQPAKRDHTAEVRPQPGQRRRDRAVAQHR